MILELLIDTVDRLNNLVLMNNVVYPNFLHHILKISCSQFLHVVHAHVLADQVVGVLPKVSPNTTQKICHIRSIAAAVVTTFSQVSQFSQKSFSQDPILHAQILLDIFILEKKKNIPVNPTFFKHTHILGKPYSPHPLHNLLDTPLRNSVLPFIITAIGRRRISPSTPHSSNTLTYSVN